MNRSAPAYLEKCHPERSTLGAPANDLIRFDLSSLNGARLGPHGTWGKRSEGPAFAFLPEHLQANHRIPASKINNFDSHSGPSPNLHSPPMKPYLQA